MLLTILRNNDEWRVYPEELAKRHSDGLASVRAGLKELEQAGYVRTYKKIIRRSDGLQHYRFCSDCKISDEAYKQLVEQLENELSD
ncbi:helix-turn-helix domain-containing protein [Streptococcus equi subsp. equi]|uniref:transcriptional regulator n=1 Tax=Streptococcus equi TaxID=1336 RepID=UPI0006599815|nr:transcriptional regulator [Streptococcus equi]MCD3372995.1 helix-turn-helix domain-containing protein [Streptococcus equi subsp. zooepidemicus]MCD3473115.1 helix-turn-helix domain-containing protein [Streptococcus equi subsp. equi]MCD3495837.1 helix-turn-helix domain-containing protein [Streptococcus equi subsp. equi]MCD3496874.1 helix-turn-helix domain-containing protein [Streptococcus equi subsp. equi]MCD3497936.1 helix-turn-helix domain-containing protein [Streptococcus equi subsp. equi]